MVRAHACMDEVTSSNGLHPAACVRRTEIPQLPDASQRRSRGTYPPLSLLHVATSGHVLVTQAQSAMFTQIIDCGVKTSTGSSSRTATSYESTWLHLLVEGRIE